MSNEPNGKAIQKQVTPIDKLKTFMRSDMIMERFQEILGERGARAYVSSVILAVANNEALQKCTQASIVSSALRAATLSLSCDPAIGQAYLVPYGNVATFVVGYKGLRDMALRTNKYRYLHADKFYKGEGVEIDRITGSARIIGRKESNEISGWAASFEMTNGFRKTVYMSREEIHEHAKQYSKGYDRGGGVWKQNPEAMEKKTVLRLLLLHWGTLDSRDELFMNIYDESELEDLDTIESKFIYQPEEREPIIEEKALAELGFNGAGKVAETIIEVGYQDSDFDPSLNDAPFDQEVDAVETGDNPDPFDAAHAELPQVLPPVTVKYFKGNIIERWVLEEFFDSKPAAASVFNRSPFTKGNHTLEAIKAFGKAYRGWKDSGLETDAAIEKATAGEVPGKSAVAGNVIGGWEDPAEEKQRNW